MPVRKHPFSWWRCAGFHEMGCLASFPPAHMQNVIIRDICFELCLYVSTVFLLSPSEGLMCVAWASGFLYPVIRRPDLRKAGMEQPDERATSNALWQCERTWKNRWRWNVKMSVLWNAQILLCTSLPFYVCEWRLCHKYSLHLQLGVETPPVRL